jgi:hypothetical protein
LKLTLSKSGSRHNFVPQNESEWYLRVILTSLEWCAQIVPTRKVEGLNALYILLESLRIKFLDEKPTKLIMSTI